MRDLENGPDVEALFKQLMIEQDKSARLEIVRKINKRGSAPSDLQAMIREAKAALKLFEENDIERALIHYDHMHEDRANCNLPLQKEEFIHAQRVEDGPQEANKLDVQKELSRIRIKQRNQSI